MKFKNLYFLSTKNALIAAISALFIASITSSPSHKSPAPQQTKIPTFIPLTEKIDTILVTEENYNTMTAAGEYTLSNNTLVLNYYITNSDNKTLRDFCELNQKALPLIEAHEKEHANKAFFTKNTLYFDPFTRGKIAAMNEIIAPAAEIIRALELTTYKNPKPEITRSAAKKALQEINETMHKENLPVLNFQDPRIADIIIKHSLEKFCHEVTQKNMYKTAILYNMQNPTSASHIKPHITNSLLFAPSADIWDLLWEFDSQFGPINPYRYASHRMRTHLLTTVNKLVTDIAHENDCTPPLLRNPRTR